MTDRATDTIRLDRGNLLRFERTPEGYLRGDAIVSRTGVFPYRNDDGSIRYELRHPDDILTQATLDSIKGVPVTMDHPSELVNADNAKQLTIGYVGDHVRVDGPNIVANFTVTDADAIRQIEAGKRGLSLGYRVADLKRQDGEYNGQKFTHRQTGTTVNHLAVCVAGRVGTAARINLDGASVQLDETTEESPDMPETPNLVAVNLDSLTYQAAPEVARALTAQTARADAAEADTAKVRADMQSELDKVQAKLDEATESLKARSDAAIAEQVAARVALLSEASKFTGDADLSAKSPREIREAVIATKYDGLDLSGKSDDYVTARYDSIIEATRDDAAAKQVEKSTPKRGDSKETRTDAADAFAAIQAQSRKSEGSK